MVSMLRNPVVVGLTLFWASWAWADEGMELVFETTQPGGVVVTGNTLGLATNAGYTGPGIQGAIGAFITVDDTQQLSPAWPMGTTGDWRENASMAVLDLPYDAEVLHALLIWGGSYEYATEGTEVLTADQLDVAVSFTTPAVTTAVSPQRSRTLRQDPPEAPFRVRYYARAADVTDLVREGGAGEYVVGGVPGTIDPVGRELNSAGWTLAVVYRALTEPTRNSTLFFGGVWLNENSAVETEVAGFCAPPSGTVEGRLSVSAVEGDVQFTGDRLFILPEAGGTEPVLLSGPNNPAGNFFGSMIVGRDGQVDTRGTFGDRNHDPTTNTPLSGGRQSWDITTVSLTSTAGQLSNGQRRARLRATNASGGTTSDSYLLTLLGLEITVNAPRFRADDGTPESLTGLWEVIPAQGTGALPAPNAVVPGDRVDLVFEVQNRAVAGGADAEDVRWRLPLPEGLSYVAGSFSVGGSGTGVDGVPVTQATLVDGIPLGRIQVGETRLVSLQLQVDARPPRGDRHTLIAFWDYTWRACADSDLESRVTAQSNRITLESAHMEVDKRLDPPTTRVRSGDPLTWVITIRNTGTVPTRQLVLVEDAPAGTTYVLDSTEVEGVPFADGPSGMPFAGGALVPVPGQALGRLPAGESVEIRFQTRVEGCCDPIRNTARVRDGGEDDAADEVEIEIEVVPEDSPDVGSPPDATPDAVDDVGEEDASDLDAVDDVEPDSSADAPDARTDTASPEEPDIEEDEDARGDVRPPRDPEDVGDASEVSASSRDTGCCAVAGGRQAAGSIWMALLVLALIRWRRIRPSATRS